MKERRVFLVHGWGEKPDGNWFSWIKGELEKNGFKVIAPEMPDTNFPKVGAWVEKLREEVGHLDKDTYFIGHSMGCQTIMRTIESFKEKERCGGAVFVAGWIQILEMPNLSAEESEIVKSWIKGDVDFGKVKHILGASVAIFSDNDPFIPLEQEKLFRDKLGAKTIVQHARGHFTARDGITEFPLALQELLEVAG
ncbi:MAG: alpha/beta hydrolase [Candidatus Aenigmarchaeota archaeon]|nr:alpha/beta hydrolase [Candidatus Aenigmarchaeota archaeon]